MILVKLACKRRIVGFLSTGISDFPYMNNVRCASTGKEVCKTSIMNAGEVNVNSNILVQKENVFFKLRYFFAKKKDILFSCVICIYRSVMLVEYGRQEWAQLER